ncbi:type VII secretion-associated serine protease mycosin, partial [Micromonospora noduli]
MRVNVGSLRPVTACLLAGLLVVGAAQPAAAAPRRAEQWYLDELRIDQAHKISTGRGVVVAVIDTGVEAGHPDLRGQVLAGGRSYGASGDGRADEDGHGTHMAGIIAAKGSSDGVTGIAPGVKILPIKLRKEDGVYKSAGMARGIRMAVDGGAKVINISIGGAGLANPVEESAIKYALDHDVVVVASAGNTASGRTAVGSPANAPGVIAVTGTTRGGAFWSGSVQGPEAVVAAPGDGIYNVANEGGYGWGDGTSDSSAIVSGLAALIRSKYPDLSAPNVINRIIRTARDAGVSGRDPQYGFGVIDPTKALTANVPPVTANPLLDPAAAATDPGPARAGGADEEFDVTQHGDRGGPTDQQVMVVGIGIAVVLVLLLGLVVFLIWNRRRYRREAARAADIPDEVLDRAAQGAYSPPDA